MLSDVKSHNVTSESVTSEYTRRAIRNSTTAEIAPVGGHYAVQGHSRSSFSLYEIPPKLNAAFSSAQEK